MGRRMITGIIKLSQRNGTPPLHLAVRAAAPRPRPLARAFISALMPEHPGDRRNLTIFGLLPPALALYLALKLTYDFVSGDDSWPLYLPGILAAAAVVVISRRRAARPRQNPPA